MFNASEYMHLSVQASSRGDHMAALGFLKEALTLEPKNAIATYLFAVECAEVGLHERAARGLEESLVLDSGLDVARFQLSMMYWQAGEGAAAKKHLTVLRDVDDAELQVYAEAILALLENDVEKAKERLSLGLRMVGNNPALKRNMHNLFQQLASMRPAPAPAPAPAMRPVSELETKAEMKPATAAVVLPGAYGHLRTAQ